MHRRAAGHSWEQYGPLDPGYAGPLEDFWNPDDSDAEPAELSAAEAGDELASLLISLRLKGCISATQCCTLAHWATAAGAAGPCREFALPPGQSGGTCQRKLDVYLRVAEDAPLYAMPVAGFDRGIAERTVHSLKVLPPHESISAEIAANPALLQELQASPAATWSPAYERHPLVRKSARGTVFPLALYMDAVPYTKLDGFLGIWCYNLLSWRRHLIAVVRRSQMCQCGCRKWCTLDPIFRMMQWSLLCLAVGRNPTTRHDGLPFQGDQDQNRAVRGGLPLIKAAVIVIKGDWSEFCSTLGFATWSSATDPCLFCHCRREGLYNVRGWSALSFPHAPKTDDEYAEACTAAEIRVLITAQVHQEVSAALRYDKRRDGSHGRSLDRDFPLLRLRRNDRLEPCTGLRDVGRFEFLEEFPAEVLFWRSTAQTWTSHRNPLFDPALGMGLGTLGVDTLHCLHLGIYKKFAAKAFWTLLLGDAWDLSDAAAGRRNQEELVANGLLALKSELIAWYESWEAEHLGIKLNRIADLNVHTLGDRDKCALSTKAAETRPLVLFCAVLTQRHQNAIHHPDLVVAAGALARFSELIRTCPVLPPPAHLGNLVESLKTYVVTSIRAGVPPTPKLHLALHLVERSEPSNSFSPNKKSSRQRHFVPIPINMTPLPSHRARQDSTAGFAGGCCYLRR